jgi:[protein-PII] uridylyltransferase
MTIVGNPLSSTAPELVRQTFLATGDVITALAERTSQVDRLVQAAAEELLFPACPQGSVALLAVGGYGRRHLFPYSDIDLLLLFSSERLPLAHKSAISAFLQSLWDAGLRMSHSVRTREECTEVHDQNIELNVSLLDQRYLAGDRALYAGLADKLPRFILANRDALSRNLVKLTRERHAKYRDTLYHLEPNVKETPGGLRDFQLICWLEQMHNTDAQRMGAADPSPELLQAFRHMSRLRAYLHCMSGRDNNTLSFDAQDAMAEQWGHVDTATWMREYFRHARAIHRQAIRRVEASEAQYSSLFAQFREWRSRLGNADFSVHRERVHFRLPQQLEAEPAVILRLFEFVARHGVRLSAEAEQQIAARLPRLGAYFADSQPLWRPLETIFSLPHAALAVRSMHETGALTAVFPELSAMECLVIRDFFHRYTVDEHTLVTIENLGRLQGQYGDLRSEVRQHGVLAFAMLFHDAGKASPDEGPVDASVHLAETAARRIQMPAADRETALFLIRRHLDLSAALQSRDIYDPAAIREIAQQVETVERLKLLTLVTYVDVSAVNPEVMTPWRADQLWQLYLGVYNELTSELETDRIAAPPAGSPERVAFLAGFPTRYLRTHTQAEIDEHVALELQSRTKGVAVDIRRLDAAWQMTLVTADRPGLFARVAGTLSSFGMNIMRAEAFANRQGVILDTFTFEDPMRTLELNPTEVDRLRSTAERVILGKKDVRDLLRNRPKPALPSRKSRIAARVSFNPDASQSATLVEIVAEDRPGLLYDVATAFSSNGANIEVVLIDTEAHKAIDVFYVTSQGKKLNSEQQEILAAALRQACQPA